MPKHSDSEDDLPLELTDPKSVFHRTHTSPKLYSRREHYMLNRGIVVRGLDMRHTQTNEMIGNRLGENNLTKRTLRFLSRRTVSYPSRQQIINHDRFGMDTLNLDYSLSKRKRWLLPKYFEQNANSYQFEDEKIWTVLATSESPLLVGLFGVPTLFPYTYNWNKKGAAIVKRLITCNEDGTLYVRENKQSRGNAFSYLKALTPADHQPSILTNRKLSKRQLRLLAAQCQEDPVRITYYACIPRVSLNFMNSTAQSRWGDGNERRRYEARIANKSQCSRDYDHSFYDEPLDFDLDEQFEDLNNESLFAPPEPMTLADFIDDQLLEMILLESSFEFIGLNDGFSIDDYDFAD